MKLDLFESGIQNINELAKKYRKSIIYGHIDLDGITSGICAKAYLEQYGIETVEFQKIQYGATEYSITKPRSDDILPVLVDFSHGKPFMKIHTDHHDGQISYNTTSSQFRKSRSNAETLSTIISTYDIFPQEDVRIINMVDSANYREEGVDKNDIIKAVLKIQKDNGVKSNRFKMGLICNKLLLTFKNKPGFMEEIVMTSGPSLLSMYNTILKIIRRHVEAGDRGWVSPETIEQNSENYLQNQEKKSIGKASLEDIDKMGDGQSALIGNVIFQVGGGNVRATGSYDRYTAFRLYPEAKYFIMLWDSLGMMQVSKNPFIEDSSEKHLGELVLGDIFKGRYARYMAKNPNYKISLLAIKKEFESNLTGENEEEAIGFNYDEFIALFNDFMEHKNYTDKQKYVLKKWMNWKPSDFTKEEGNSRKNDEIDRALKMLSSIYIPLPQIVEKLSGGHPSITNLSGFNLYDINKKIKNDLEKVN